MAWSSSSPATPLYACQAIAGSTWHGGQSPRLLHAMLQLVHSLCLDNPSLPFSGWLGSYDLANILSSAFLIVTFSLSLPLENWVFSFVISYTPCTSLVKQLSQSHFLTNLSMHDMPGNYKLLEEYLYRQLPSCQLEFKQSVQSISEGINFRISKCRNGSRVL